MSTNILSDLLIHPVSCIGSTILGSIFYFLKLTVQSKPSNKEKLLRIIVYISLCLSIPISMLLAKKWGSMKHPYLRIGVYCFVFIATSLYSFFEDKINGSLFDLFSYAAFSLASLSISKQIDFGFEVGMFSFFLQSLTTTAFNMNNIFFVIFTLLFCCLLISIRFYLECFKQTHTTNSNNSYPLHQIRVDSQPVHSNQEIYDVFVSFVYDETICDFIDYLLSALLRKGIKTSLTSSSSYLSSIESSKISLVILSQDYAYWEQRLDELEKIMECRSTSGQIVVPIYHNIDPSHVKFQSGTYSDAFAIHEQEFEKQKVENWREAMSKAAQLFGWYTNSTSYSYVHPSIFVDQMIQDVLQKLQNPFPPKTLYDNYVYVSNFGRGAYCGDWICWFLHKRNMIVSTSELKGYTETECHTRAIERSKIVFVIFSEDYAESEWCLDRLLEIMECHERYGQIVMPIFYEISPSEVRKQSGSYGVAFGKYENIEKVRKWRRALSKVANMVGWNTSFHGISLLAEEIAEDVVSKFQSNS